MTDLSVSVIIPVFNGERFLAEAIESVLAQAYHPLEIIVVDDGSTDSTGEIAHRFADQISYMRQPNRGPAAARNAGLRHAQGDLINFLDHDDLWTPGKLASQGPAFAKSPSVKIVLGHLQRLKLTHSHGFVSHGSPELSLNLGASLIRRQVFHAVGTFDESLRWAEDLDWYMRARELGVSILVQNDVVLFYRRHDTNLTNQTQETNRGAVQAVRRSLERRRKQHGSASSLPPVRGRTFENADPQDEPECR